MKDGTGSAMIAAMKEYARQACEEQSKICLDAVASCKDGNMSNAVYYAPQPELL